MENMSWKLTWLGESPNLIPALIRMMSNEIGDYIKRNNVWLSTLVKESHDGDGNSVCIEDSSLVHGMEKNTTEAIVYICEQFPSIILILVKNIIEDNKERDQTFINQTIKSLECCWIEEFMKNEDCAMVETYHNRNVISINFQKFRENSAVLQQVHVWKGTRDSNITNLSQMRNKLELFSQSKNIKTVFATVPSKALREFLLPRPLTEIAAEIETELEPLLLTYEKLDVVFMEAKDYYGSLSKWLQNHKGDPIATHTLGLFQSLIYELQEIHKLGVVHGGISPSNIFDKQQYMGPRFDFYHALGIPRCFPPDMNDIEESLFVAPEMRTEDGTQDFQSDIYSLGMVFLAILSQNVADVDTTDLETVAKTCPALASSKTLSQMISFMVQKFPCKRMTEEEFQSLLETIDWDELYVDFLDFHGAIMWPRNDLSAFRRLDDKNVAIKVLTEMKDDIVELSKQLTRTEQNETFADIFPSDASQCDTVMDLLRILEHESPLSISGFFRRLARTPPWNTEKFIQNLFHKIDSTWLTNLKNIHYLGSGAFGDVVKADVGTEQRETVALKLILPRSDKEVDNLKREIGIMAKILHPNIAVATSCMEAREFSEEEISKFLTKANGFVSKISGDSSSFSSSSCESSKDGKCQLWAISMSVYGPDLETWLNYSFQLRQNFDIHSAKKALLIIRGVIRGIKYLHKLKIMHRDIKPSNILFSCSDVENEFHLPVVITDFGVSKEMPEQAILPEDVAYPVQGNPRFRAPEVWDGKGVTLQAEVFSVGLLILAVVLPIEGKQVHSVAEDLLKNYKQVKFEECSEVQLFLKNVISMIQPNLKERMSSQEFEKFDMVWDSLKGNKFQKLLTGLIHPKYFVSSKY